MTENLTSEIVERFAALCNLGEYNITILRLNQELDSYGLEQLLVSEVSSDRAYGSIVFITVLFRFQAFVGEIDSWRQETEFNAKNLCQCWDLGGGLWFGRIFP